MCMHPQPQVHAPPKATLPPCPKTLLPANNTKAIRAAAAQSQVANKGWVVQNLKKTFSMQPVMS